MANLTVYLLKVANLRSVDRHLRYPGKQRRPWRAGIIPAKAGKMAGRGLHSFTSQLNLSAFYGIGGARRGCVARVRGMFIGGV